MFIDQVKIYVKAGDGGDGCVSFRREKYVPRGGPDGGDGGKGGDIILEASSNLSTLMDLRYQQHYMVKRAEHGSGQNRSGHSSPDLIIPVPVGTLVRNAETDAGIADLTEVGQRVVVARGGRGGRGNSHFKSPTRQAPRIAEPGGKGEEQWLQLELKLLADVGLVGLPNAGKSTLISVVSAARPKIANYPFTTLEPNLGVVTWGGEVRGQTPLHFTIADIPGLIEGAHEGKGLGIRFLKHIERTLLLLHLVDISETGTEDPLHDLEVVRAELAAYHPTLAEKPFMVAATKIDIAGDEARQEQLRRYCKQKKIPFFEISAATGKGIKPLVRTLGNQVELLRKTRTAVPPAAESEP
ncbi:MAG: GTPase ObgE [Nitrospirae bacterium]|nr:GTPase ObgE [Candidatus Manganitrophaceae bacterium]